MFWLLYLIASLILIVGFLICAVLIAYVTFRRQYGFKNEYMSVSTWDNDLDMKDMKEIKINIRNVEDKKD